MLEDFARYAEPDGWILDAVKHREELKEKSQSSLVATPTPMDDWLNERDRAFKDWASLENEAKGILKRLDKET